MIIASGRARIMSQMKGKHEIKGREQRNSQFELDSIVQGSQDIPLWFQ